MTKKMKKGKVEEAPIEVVEEVTEVKDSDKKKALKHAFAVQKAHNPELYAIKNKDEELERKLKAL